jgi:hypothetical protein
MIVDSYHNNVQWVSNELLLLLVFPIDGSSKKTVDIYREKVCTKMDEPFVIYFNRCEDVLFTIFLRRRFVQKWKNPVSAISIDARTCYLKFFQKKACTKTEYPVSSISIDVRTCHLQFSTEERWSRTVFS